MKFKKTAAFWLAAAMSFSLAACNGGSGGGETGGTSGNTGGGSTSGEAPVTGLETPTLIVLNHRTDRDKDGSLAEMTKSFEEKYNCKVEYRTYTNYAEDAATVLGSPNWGDVMMIPDSVGLKDLGSFFEPLGSFDDLSKDYNWVGEKMSDGTVYGIPHAGNVSGGLCYNKRIWTEAGVTTLPKTPDEFVAALNKIHEAFPEGVIPLYTNFAAGWPMQGWRSLGYSAAGDPDWRTNLLVNKEEPFASGGPLYEAAKLLFDVFSDPALIEGDPSTSDWEACKSLINEGKIATIVLESWAVSQFKEAGPNPDDIGFMPVPFTTNGKQYAESGGDYHLGVNKNNSDDQKELAKNYVFWFVDESGFAASEGMLSVKKGSPVSIENFENVEMFSFNPAPAGLGDAWDDIDKASDVNINAGGDAENYKIKIAEAAFAGKPFSEIEAIFADLNSKWATARDANADLQNYLAQ
jgi:ABC-type glycerol-3-phosphate transport system substrate-binding protein